MLFIMKGKEELVKTARDKANKLNQEADKKAKQLVDTARQQAKKIKDDAQSRVDKL